MSLSILAMVVATVLIVTLFLAGASLITSALARSKPAESTLVPANGSKPPSRPLIIGIILVVLSVLVCVYSGLLMFSTF